MSDISVQRYRLFICGGGLTYQSGIWFIATIIIIIIIIIYYN